MEELKKTGRPPVAPDKALVHGTLRLTRARNGKKFAWLVFLRYGC